MWCRAYQRCGRGQPADRKRRAEFDPTGAALDRRVETVAILDADLEDPAGVHGQDQRWNSERAVSTLVVPRASVTA